MELNISITNLEQKIFVTELKKVIASYENVPSDTIRAILINISKDIESPPLKDHPIYKSIKILKDLWIQRGFQPINLQKAIEVLVQKY